MTTSTIESVIKQALKTFSFTNKDTLENFNKNFSKLLSQVSNISSEDIHFENYLLTQQVREIKRYRSDKVSNSIKVDVYHINRAPVTYIQIFENELVTLGVFVIREGPSGGDSTKIVVDCIRIWQDEAPLSLRGQN
ncbi:hypothetical protein M8J77_003147 [Diaphorina citri]|nr:hypothetical protein M8J77_003147 [Diaphorina citri]